MLDIGGRGVGGSCCAAKVSSQLACVREHRGITRTQLSLPRTNVPNDLAVNGTRDAVLQLEVHLGDGVLGENRGVRDVTCGR